MKTLTLHGLRVVSPVLFFLAGCGSLSQPDHTISDFTKTSGAQYSTTGAPPTSDQNYECPSEANVLPYKDAPLDFSGQYSVCTSKYGQDEVKFHGTTRNSDIICIYPAFYFNSSSILMDIDNDPGPNGRTIYSECQAVREEGNVFKYGMRAQGKYFNSVFVVEEEDRDAMDLCLAAQDYLSCPFFSFGRFRN